MTVQAIRSLLSVGRKEKKNHINTEVEEFGVWLLYILMFYVTQKCNHLYKTCPKLHKVGFFNIYFAFPYDSYSSLERAGYILTTVVQVSYKLHIRRALYASCFLLPSSLPFSLKVISSFQLHFRLVTASVSISLTKQKSQKVFPNDQR